MKKRGFSIAEGAVLLLVVTLIASVYVLFLQEQRASLKIFERTQQSARILASFAQEAHAQYTTSISSAVKKGGLDFSTHLENQPGSLHFPASFSRNLTEKFSSKYKGAKFSIYSNDPFGTSKGRSLDKFAIEALAAFEKRQDKKEFWFPKAPSDEVDVLRLAIPIVMEKNCVACHNSPAWNLNKRNWKEGDIRGVREVSLKFPEVRSSRIEFYALWGSILVSCGLGLFLVFPAVRREVVQRSDVENLNAILSERANELQVQATTDSLTKLYNRRHFDDLLDAYVEEFGRNNIPIGVALFDLDYFKAINDNFGHAVGDQVISKFGEVLKSHVRNHDFAARIGGEEFALVIPNITKEDLSERADRVRRSISQLDMMQSSPTLKITVSAGVAALTENESSKSLRQRADTKLYEAKNAGRNRVES